MDDLQTLKKHFLENKKNLDIQRKVLDILEKNEEQNKKIITLESKNTALLHDKTQLRAELDKLKNHKQVKRIESMKKWVPRILDHLNSEEFLHEEDIDLLLKDLEELVG